MLREIHIQGRQRINRTLVNQSHPRIANTGFPGARTFVSAAMQECQPAEERGWVSGKFRRCCGLESPRAEENPRSEGRRPKEGRSPKSERVSIEGRKGFGEGGFL